MKQTFLLLSFFLLINSCGKQRMETTGNLNLTFKATYDSELLVLNQKNYNYLEKNVRFTRINFYLGDFRLLNGNQEIEVSDIEFIDLTKAHYTETSAKEGTTLEFFNIPIGDYTGLKFGIGVPNNLNKTIPLDYPTEHPLNADFEYYEAWNSYIFAKIEGVYDVDENGFDEEDIIFAYYAGMDRNYQEIELNISKELKSGEVLNINFELDVKQLFNVPTGTLLSLEPHDMDANFPESIIIMNNFKNALQLK